MCQQTVSQALRNLNASVRCPPVPGLVSWQKAPELGQSLSPYTFQTITFCYLRHQPGFL